MIRFVDLSEAYWGGQPGSPVCAFLNTVTDAFVLDDVGCHAMHAENELEWLDLRYRDRCKALVPEGFWDR